MKRAIILFFALFIAFTNHAFAQNKDDQSTNNRIINLLSVSPVIIDTKIDKNQKYTYPIKVKNLLSVPLGIRTSIEDFNPSDEESLVNTSSKQSPIISYSNLSEESFIINPGESKTFNLEVKTPKDLKDGGYYEVVFLTPFYVKALQTTSPTVLSKIGVLVLANSGNINYKDLQNKVKILSFSLEDDKLLTPLIRVQNLYFNHFSAKPFITLTPLFGTSQKFELTEKRILPGKTRRWEEEIKPKNKSIFYTAKLALSVGQGNYIYKDTFFILFPIKKVILIIVLILFISVIFWRRKQIKRAIRVIISGK